MHTTPAVLYCIGVCGRISPDVQSLNFYCSRIIVTRQARYLVFGFKRGTPLTTVLPATIFPLISINYIYLIVTRYLARF